MSTSFANDVDNSKEQTMPYKEPRTPVYQPQIVRRKAGERKVNHEKLDEVKREICQVIRRIALREGWNQQRLAIYCGTNETWISKVIRQDIEKLTINQLFRYLVAICPGFRFLIAM
jgi:ribosome-binding protein aMBF1 (putative translation factor)